MRKAVVVLLLVGAIVFSGCTGGGGAPPWEQRYYYEISGIEVYREWYDFGLVYTGVNPKLDLSELTVTKVAGSASESKYPQDESEANARITLFETNTVWLIRVERGTSKSLRLITNKLSETGGTFTFVAEGKDTDLFGNEMGTWHESDKQQVSYTVHESSVGLISLKDERLLISKLIDSIFNNYEIYLSREVKGGTEATKWLDSKLSELERENNSLSEVLKAYSGAVIAIVVVKGDDVVYRKIYRIESGHIVETTDEPDVIIVIDEEDLQEVKERYEIYEKNGWTSEEIAQMKLLILSKVRFQGNLIPR